VNDSLELVSEIGAKFLLHLGRTVRAKAIAGRNVERDSLSVGFVGGDTIYEIDRRVEVALTEALRSTPAALLPLIVVAEGMDANSRFGFGGTNFKGQYRLLIDPIDGTRELMYDKRSAWFLAALAPDSGLDTKLGDIIVSVMVEIPTSKQRWADVYWATTEGGIFAAREALDTGETIRFNPMPSRAESLDGGFAQVSNFFPGTKRLASDLMERIVESGLGPQQAGKASVFEDQYISTGGQLVELLAGRDRFTCDLRPLFYRALEIKFGGRVVRGLECHPYDLAGVHLAQMGGVVLTDGFGKKLDGPFDLTTGMHWIGYANETIRAKIEPTILAWLGEHGIIS
jgi:hypothetical protein